MRCGYAVTGHANLVLTHQGENLFQPAILLGGRARIGCNCVKPSKFSSAVHRPIRQRRVDSCRRLGDAGGVELEVLIKQPIRNTSATLDKSVEAKYSKKPRACQGTRFKNSGSEYRACQGCGRDGDPSIAGKTTSSNLAVNNVAECMPVRPGCQPRRYFRPINGR